MLFPHHYLVFGLHVGSELLLTGLAPAETGGPIDVAVRLGPVAEVADGRSGYRIEGGAAYLTISEVARFRIADGCEILVDPAPGAAARNVRLFVLGSSFGAILHQRGLLPLHANAIDMGGAAIAFMGHSGAGKSTMAAWFHDRGHGVLTDDVCVVEQGGDGAPVAHRGIPRLRLWREALERSGREADGFELSYDGVDKFDVPIAEGGAAALPLAGVYLLRRSEDGLGAIERLTGMRAVEALVANTYRGGYVRLAGAAGAHLARCVALARAAPVFAVRRVWGHDRFDEQASRLAEHAGSLPGVATPSIEA